MTDFQRDLETIVTNTEVSNNGTIRFVMRYRSRIDNDNITNLDLIPRAENVLLMNGIETVKQLFNNLNKVSGFKGSGIKSVKNINTALMSYYYDRLNEEERKEFWRDAADATIEMVVA